MPIRGDPKGSPFTMPEFPDFEDDVSEDNAEVEIKSLRQAAEQGKRDSAELAALKRNEALRAAGIDPTSKDGKLLLLALTADPSINVADYAPKPEPVAEVPVVDAAGEATTFDRSDHPHTAPVVEISAAEQAATGQRQALVAGAIPTPIKVDVDPYKAAYQESAQGLVAGRTREQAMAAAVGVVREAGAAGDARVLYRGPTEG